MVKNKTEELEEEDLEDDEDTELEDFDEEEEEEPIKKKKGKLKSKNWIVQHDLEMWTVINPSTKEVMAQAPTQELLSLQLQTIAAQKASESSKQTE